MHEQIPKDPEEGRRFAEFLREIDRDLRHTTLADLISRKAVKEREQIGEREREKQSLEDLLDDIALLFVNQVLSAEARASLSAVIDVLKTKLRKNSDVSLEDEKVVAHTTCEALENLMA